MRGDNWIVNIILFCHPLPRFLLKGTTKRLTSSLLLGIKKKRATTNSSVVHVVIVVRRRRCGHHYQWKTLPPPIKPATGISANTPAAATSYYHHSSSPWVTAYVYFSYLVSIFVVIITSVIYECTLSAPSIVHLQTPRYCTGYLAPRDNNVRSTNAIHLQYHLTSHWRLFQKKKKQPHWMMAMPLFLRFHPMQVYGQIYAMLPRYVV